MATTFGTLPKIVRRVEGGTLRIGNTRVSLDSVVYAYNRGEGAIEIQRAFDTLSLADIHAAIAYYLHNREKVDKYLAKRVADFERDRVRPAILRFSRGSAAPSAIKLCFTVEPQNSSAPRAARFRG